MTRSPSSSRSQAHPTATSSPSSPRPTGNRSGRPSSHGGSGDPCRQLACGGRRDAGCRPTFRTVLRGARRGPVPRPEPGLVGPPPCERLRPTLPQGSPGTCRSRSPWATRRRRSPSRSSSRVRRGGLVGVGPGAACRRARSWASGFPKSPPSATLPPHGMPTTPRPAAMSGSLATAACAGAGEPKAIAAGADVLMIGSPLARAAEAPGRGTNWEMAAPSPTLPRGTRIRVQHRGKPFPADPVRPRPRQRRLGEPRRRPAPVDGGARRPHDPRPPTRGMVHAPRPRPRESPGSGGADERRPGSHGGESLARPEGSPASRRSVAARASRVR